MLVKTEKAIKSAVLCSAIALCIGGTANTYAGSFTQALKTGKASGSILTRREVNNTANGDVVNVRSRLGYTTGGFNGFTATLEFEDSRFIFGEDDNAGILEQEFTEVEQAFVQYKDTEFGLTAKLGRQVIALDGQRHIGHVGWRLDRQTFDAGRVIYSPIKDLKIDYSYVYKVNRINSSSVDGAGFGDVDNVDANLLNVSYKTPIGKLTAYGYMIDEEVADVGAVTPTYDETDTYGLSLGGAQKIGDSLKILYNLEYAIQDNKTNDVEPDYSWVEVGLAGGGVTGKLGIETLGSDTNGGVTNSFETPYATVHKFAGWADVFAVQSLFGGGFGGVGLKDTYASVATKKLGPKVVVAYHVFEPDASAAYDTFGDELDLLVVQPLNKVFTVGAKLAKFNGRADAPTGDKEVYWFWLEAKI